MKVISVQTMRRDDQRAYKELAGMVRGILIEFKDVSGFNKPIFKMMKGENNEGIHDLHGNSDFGDRRRTGEGQAI
jgi:hypothetical protein